MMVGLVLDPLAGAGQALGGEAEEGKVAQLGAVVQLQSGLCVGKLLVKWSESWLRVPEDRGTMVAAVATILAAPASQDQEKSGASIWFWLWFRSGIYYDGICGLF